MAYEYTALGALEYDPCRYGASQLVMRGPASEIDGDTVVCLGGTETFGKFVPEPYPVLLGQILEQRVVNLGVVHAGLDAFAQDAAIQKEANRAACRVVQVMGAHTVSNGYYRVHPRRNDRFIAPTEALVELYPEVDFTEFHFTRALLLRLRQVSRKRFDLVVSELKRCWSAAMDQLVAALDGPVVLLRVADAPLEEAGDQKMRGGALFVDRQMLARYAHIPQVEVEISPAARATNTRGMVFAALQEPMAAELLGPAGQSEVAVALSGPVKAALAG